MLSSLFYLCRLLIKQTIGITVWFYGTGVWTQDFALSRQVLHHLCHTISLFCSAYFGCSVSYFSQASLDHDSPILCSLPLLRWQACATILSFYPWRRSLQTFFVQAGLQPWSFWSQPSAYLGMAGIHHHNQVTIGWNGVLQTFCQYWPKVMILQISASQLAGITGVSHWHLPFIVHYVTKLFKFLSSLYILVISSLSDV
jgi:hypothetical protein